MLPTEDGPTYEPLTPEQNRAVQAIQDRSAALQLINSDPFTRFCQQADLPDLRAFLESYVEAMKEAGL